jgi:hypothetical protein
VPGDRECAQVDQPENALAPFAIGSDYIGHVTKQNQRIVNLPDISRVKAGQYLHRPGPGLRKGDCKAAVPKPGVVRTQIADIGSVLEQRFHCIGKQPVGTGDFLAAGGIFHVAVKSAQQAK